MVKITLQSAANGIIKIVTDDQANGATTKSNTTYVYELDSDEEETIGYYESVSKFLTDVANDLGINLGSDYSQNQLMMDVNWGCNYVPNLEEINLRIKSLHSELKVCKEFRKNLLEANSENLQ